MIFFSNFYWVTYQHYTCFIKIICVSKFLCSHALCASLGKSGLGRHCGILCEVLSLCEDTPFGVSFILFLYFSLELTSSFSLLGWVLVTCVSRWVPLHQGLLCVWGCMKQTGFYVSACFQSSPRSSCLCSYPHVQRAKVRISEDGCRLSVLHAAHAHRYLTTLGFLLFAFSFFGVLSNWFFEIQILVLEIWSAHCHFFSASLKSRFRALKSLFCDIDPGRMLD